MLPRSMAKGRVSAEGRACLPWALGWVTVPNLPVSVPQHVASYPPDRDRRLLLKHRGDQDGRHAGQTKDCADDIPSGRDLPLYGPEPGYRCCDVYAAVGCICATGKLDLNPRQQVCEQGEGDGARDKPEGRAVKPQPGPEREASRDLGESSQRIHADRDEDAHHGRAVLHCHGSSSSSRLIL